MKRKKKARVDAMGYRLLPGSPEPPVPPVPPDPKIEMRRLVALGREGIETAQFSGRWKVRTALDALDAAIERLDAVKPQI